MSGPGLPTGRRLDLRSTRDVADALAAGAATLVVPLGSTEQHGAHLPLGTDTLIADALAERFCARHPDAWALPALPLGCADEHMGFAGTMSLSEATLHAVVGDVLRSAAVHGFARGFVFSAHGGNVGALERLAEALVRDGVGLDVCVFSDLRRVAEAQARVAAEYGISAEAAGHHAGEWETSVVAALAPEAVDLDAARPGVLADAGTAGTLFYPRLDAKAPGGVVGDPTGADATRAEAYLGAWVDVLDAVWADAFGVR